MKVEIKNSTQFLLSRHILKAIYIIKLNIIVYMIVTGMKKGTEKKDRQFFAAEQWWQTLIISTPNYTIKLNATAHKTFIFLI